MAKKIRLALLATSFWDTYGAELAEHILRLYRYSPLETNSKYNKCSSYLRYLSLPLASQLSYTCSTKYFSKLSEKPATLDIEKGVKRRPRLHERCRVQAGDVRA